MLYLASPLSLAGLLGYCLTTSGATAVSRVALPAPTGRYQVGRSVAELIDYKHVQPFAPIVEPRKLMISVFYPVTPKQPISFGKYMPFETARFEDMNASTSTVSFPNGTFEPLALHLVGEDAAWKSSKSDFPLVLFMPAEGTTRLFYSLIASTIASNGYTLVTIDTPYDIDIVEYPDGSVALLNETTAGTKNQTQLLLNAILAVQTRAQDAGFVLDSLSNSSLAHSLIPNLSDSGLNTSHVAMFGHSLGGAATLTAMDMDSRILGGLDMDGGIFPPTDKTDTDRPFMIMAHQGNTRTANPLDAWATTWKHLKGWKRDVIVEGFQHYDFSDIPIVLETLGITPDKRSDELLHLGPIKGSRALEIVTTYVTAFLDFVVYGKCSALLDGPVKEFPEVSFER